MGRVEVPILFLWAWGFSRLNNLETIPVEQGDDDHFQGYFLILRLVLALKAISFKVTLKVSWGKMTPGSLGLCISCRASEPKQQKHYSAQKVGFPPIPEKVPKSAENRTFCAKFYVKSAIFRAFGTLSGIGGNLSVARG